MTTLVLRLAGPIQSYGGRAAGAVNRPTGDVPTKSAVTGILAAAYGYDRSDPRAAALAHTFELSVRVEQPGTRLRDFHTATPADDDAVVTERWYLADAVFLAFLQFSDSKLADDAVRALREPVFTPFLGRKTCVPEQPLVYMQSEEPATELIATLPQAATLNPEPGFETEVELAVVTPHGTDTVRDIPTGGRNFESRTVSHSTVRVSGSAPSDRELHFRRGYVAPPKPKFKTTAPKPFVGELTHVTVGLDSVFGYVAGNRHRLHGYVANRADEALWSEEVSDDGSWLRITIQGRHEASRFPGADVEYSSAVSGERLPFTITVNPTRTANGRRYGIKDPKEQLDWLNARIPGAKLVSGRVAASRSSNFTRQKKTVSLLIARLEGELVITDAEAFEEGMATGIGRAKAYGCGLLLTK